METQIRSESAPPWTTPRPGVRVRPLVEGSGTGLMLYQLEPGTTFPIHSHPFPELGLVLAGTGFMVIHGEDRPLRTGDSYYYPSSVPHGFRVPTDGEAVLLLDVSAAGEGEIPPSLQEIVGAMRRQARTLGQV